MANRRSGWPVRAAVMVVSAAVAFVRPALAQQDTSLAAGIFSVRLLGGPERVVRGFARDTFVLVPVREILDLSEVRVTLVVPGDRVEIMLEPGAIVAAISTTDTSVWSGTRRIPFEAGGAVWVGGNLYATGPVLATLLGAQATVDWTELTIILSEVDRLPVMMRLGRESRRRWIEAATLGVVPDSLISPRTALVDGAGVDWSAFASLEDPLGNNVVQFTGGLAALGGSLELAGVFQRFGTTRSSTTRSAWTRAWPSATQVRQVRVGDVVLDPIGVPVRGGLITNIPYLRPSDFGIEPLTGRLPPGWDVEVVRGGRVVAYGALDSTGRYQVDAPLVYGVNPTEIRAYGPNGEIVVTQRSLEVLPERLPARRFEYLVGGGDCQLRSCSGLVEADGRYGLTGILTARGGLLGVRLDTGSVSLHPYVELALAATSSVQLLGEAMADGLARGRVLYSPNTDTRVDVVHTVYAPSEVRGVLGGGSDLWRTVASGFWRPRDGRFQVRGAFAASRSATGNTGLLAVGGLMRVPNGTVALNASRERVGSSEPRSLVEAEGRVFVSGRSPLAKTLVGVSFATACGADWFACSPSLDAWGITAGRDLGPTVRLDAGVSWRRGAGGVAAEVVLSALVPFVRSVTRSAVDGDGTWAGSQLLEGSVLFDRPGGRLMLGDGRSVGRSGVSGLVYFDENRNGRRDAGEEAAPDVLLRVGSRAVETDASGRFRTMDLLPFERTLLEVDTLSMPDPTWMSPANVLALSPVPNTVGAIEIGLVRGRELNGTVELDGREPGPLRLQLLPVGGGPVREIATFSDGSFYLPAVRPGTYDLRPHPEDLERLGAEVTPIRVTLEPDAPGAVVVRVTMTRR